MACVCRGQNIFDSYFAITSNFLGYIYFFILYKIKPHSQVIVQLIFVYAVLYVLFFIWAMVNAPNIVIGGAEEELDESRGIFRVRVPGLHYIVLCFFYSVTQIIKSYKWVIPTIVSYVFIILSLTRQIIALSLLIAGLYLVWKKKWLRVVVALFAVLILGFQNVNIKFNDSSILGALINNTTNQFEDQGSDDIRIRAFNAFLTEFHQNTFEMLFGAGFSHATRGKYGAWENRNFIDNGYYRSDVGYAGTYVTFGIFGLIVFMLMFYKALKVKNVGTYIYAQLFLYYCLFANITSWPLRTNPTEICICLHLLCISQIETNLTHRKT